MSVPEQNASNQVNVDPPPIPPPSTTADVENQAPAPATSAGGQNQTAGTGFSVGAIVPRWKGEDVVKRGSLGLRALGLLFSLLSFIIMASNKHGDWKDFDKYEEYGYVLAMAILSTLYTLLQVLRQVQEISTGKFTLKLRTLAYVDFLGDQIFAYLLISSASSAIPLTNRMRGADRAFTDSSAAAISMSFLAFLTLALSAAISGYKLSTKSYD